MQGFRSTIEKFSTSWFGIVMGTGVFASSTFLIAKMYKIEALYTLFYILTPLNFIIFLIVLVPWILRWIFFKEAMLEDFKDPIKGNFFYMLGIGMLALSSNLYFYKLTSIAYFFWIFGASSMILLQLALMFLTFVGVRVRLEHINPVWFLGTTGLLLIPGSGITILSYGEITSLHLFIFNFAFGTGFFLYLSLLAIWLYRFILHEPLKASMIPLFWINMGPIGAALASLLTYFHLYPEYIGVSLFFANLFFGFGAWWFIMSILVTLYYIRRLRLTYQSVWWSFTFPVGQYLLGLLYLNTFFNYESITFFSFILYPILIFLWFVNVILTLKSLILRGHAQK